ncbi:response regulator transcription factor [Paraburkholderia phenazinium]|uniref:response regulator transcription factor n=1 Tax=Paraburkholderia phenazinium TaxID=60549 RepID=UPI00158B119F|nr:LuxR C-terminal-related transcriptional regulator [Paraburkholderia phenazinium]
MTALPQTSQLDTETTPLLTRSEMRIAHFIAQGRTARDIAQSLNLSARTVESHTDSIKRKLNCAKKSDLFLALLQNGLIRF